MIEHDSALMITSAGMVHSYIPSPPFKCGRLPSARRHLRLLGGDVDLLRRDAVLGTAVETAVETSQGITLS